MSLIPRECDQRVARAVAEAMERCARIADQAAQRHRTGLGEGAVMAAEGIASAIRESAGQVEK